MDAKRPKHMTLNRFLVHQQRARPEAGGELTRVMNQVGTVGKIISAYMRRAALDTLTGLTGRINVQGEQVRQLDEVGNTIFVEAFEYVDIVCAIVSEEMEEPLVMASNRAPKSYVVLVDPIDGSSNLEVDCVVGSIFSIRELEGSVEESILQRGIRQVAAGYIMYGPGTVLVYTTGQGSHGFTLNPETGEFLLTHPRIGIPRRGKVYGINEGNAHSWHPGQRAFVAYLRTPDKASGRPYSLRYSGAMVADVHRTLLDGGIFMYPADMREPTKPKAKLRLLYEVAPMAMIVEQAGGHASTGTERVLDVKASEYHQRAAILIGSPDDVALAEEFYRR